MGGWRFAVVALPLVVLAGRAQAAADLAATLNEPAATELATRLTAYRPRWAEGISVRQIDAIRRQYAHRGFGPLWVVGGRLNDEGHAILTVLQAAESEGLDAQRYVPPALAAGVRGREVANPAEVDLLLTAGALRYAIELRSGRFAPQSLDRELYLSPPAPEPATVLQSLIATPDPRKLLAGFVPPQEGYAGLRRLLASLRATEKAGGWPRPGAGPVLTVGVKDASVRLVRRRLKASGDLAATAPDSDVYDQALAAAVRSFQARTGIDASGVVNDRTRAALSVPVSARIRQVQINMERWRWLPDDLGQRAVVVNIPNFSLTALVDGKPALTMPVIVGSMMRRTPQFSSRISFLVLNPTWTVPPTIARKDIIQKMLRNPNYLEQENIRITAVGSDGRPISPRAIDWRHIGANISRYRLTQMPGPQNALGQMKFMFPNQFDVYLHDTPGRDKFSRSVRSLSSGCVRLGNPDALAAFVLEQMPEWTADRRKQVLDAGHTHSITLKTPVPVHLTYQTAWLDEHGRAEFRDDIYDRDRQLADALWPPSETVPKVAATQVPPRPVANR